MARIAFSGKMASGKSTTAKHLMDEYGYVKTCMAAVMKEIEQIQATQHPEMWHTELRPWLELIVPKTNMMSGSVRSEVGQWIVRLMRKIPSTPGEKNRDFLQALGNGLREFHHEDVWVNTVITSMGNMDNVVIDDIRYPNEIERLREEGFIIVRLNVSEEVQKARYKEEYGSIEGIDFEHPGEIALDNYDDYDYVIDADISIEELHEKVDEIVAEVS